MICECLRQGTQVETLPWWSKAIMENGWDILSLLHDECISSGNGNGTAATKAGNTTQYHQFYLISQIFAGLLLYMQNKHSVRFFNYVGLRGFVIRHSALLLTRYKQCLSARTIFFSHNNPAGAVFWLIQPASRTRPYTSSWLGR